MKRFFTDFLIVMFLGAVGFGITSAIVTKHFTTLPVIMGALICACWFFQARWEKWLDANQPKWAFTAGFTFCVVFLGSTYLVMQLGKI